MSSFRCLVRGVSGSGEVRYARGHRLVDRYLEFVAGRCRPNTLRAVAFDLKAFFAVVGKDPVGVTAVDVFDFLAHQRGDRSVVRLADRESGLSARTIACRLSSVSGLYAYLIAGDTPVQASPVPRGLSTRRQDGSKRSRTVPLVRVPRTLPKILAPAGVDRLLNALRTDRDKAMVLAMVLAGLRRCEVLGLRMADVRVGDRRLFVVEGTGGHQRVVPVAGRFLQTLGDYLHGEPPATASTDRLFVVLKGPRRGLPLSAEGLDEIPPAARRRAGLEHATCHELRHTCLTQFQPGHAAGGDRGPPRPPHHGNDPDLRIADRVAADEYQAISEKIGAIYGQQLELPAGYQTTSMAKLRREAHARMLGNGLRTRPAQLDCQMESACETCSYFQTTIEFRPTLQRQRDHAQEHGQPERAAIFDKLIQRVDQEQP